MDRYCKDCRWFKDANSRVYIDPRCTRLGDEDAKIIRLYVCGVVEARMYEPKPILQPSHQARHLPA